MGFWWGFLLLIWHEFQFYFLALGYCSIALLLYSVQCTCLPVLTDRKSYCRKTYFQPCPSLHFPNWFNLCSIRASKPQTCSLTQSISLMRIVPWAGPDLSVFIDLKTPAAKKPWSLPRYKAVNIDLNHSEAG